MGNQLSYLDPKSIVDLFSSVCVTRQFLGVCNAQLWIQKAPSRARCETQVFAMLQITSRRMRKLAAVIFEHCQYIWIISPKQISWIFEHRNLFPNVQTVFGCYRGLELPFVVGPFVFPKMNTLLLATLHKSLETFPQSALKNITTLAVCSGRVDGKCVQGIKNLCPKLETLYISAAQFLVPNFGAIEDPKTIITWMISDEVPVDSNTRGPVAFVDMLASRQENLYRSWQHFAFAIHECARVDAYEEEIRIHDKDKEIAGDFLKWNFIDGKVCKDIFKYFLQQYDAIGVEGLSDKNYKQTFKLLKDLFPQFYRVLCTVGRAFNPMQTPACKPYMWCDFLTNLELPQWATSEQALEEFEYELDLCRSNYIIRKYIDGFATLITCRGADRSAAFWKPVLQMLIRRHTVFVSLADDHVCVDGLLAILQSAKTCFEECVRFVDSFCARMCNADLFRHLMLCLLQFNHRKVEVANLAMTSECILLSSDAMIEYAIFRRTTSLAAVEIMAKWDDIVLHSLVPVKPFLFAEMKDWVRDELVFGTSESNKEVGKFNPQRKLSELATTLDSIMSDLAIAQALQEQEYFEAAEFDN